MQHPLEQKMERKREKDKSNNFNNKIWEGRSEIRSTSFLEEFRSTGSWPKTNWNLSEGQIGEPGKAEIDGKDMMKINSQKVDMDTLQEMITSSSSHTATIRQLSL